MKTELENVICIEFSDPHEEEVTFILTADSSYCEHAADVVSNAVVSNPDFYKFMSKVMLKAIIKFGKQKFNN